MPHAVSPEAMATDQSSQPMPEPHDSPMEDMQEEDTKMTEEEAAKSQLEDMFDDDDETDEFSSNAVQSSPIHTSSAAAARYTDTEVMTAFYQRLFPYRYLFQWLNHSASPTNDFAHREFAFTLPNDAYLRYQSFTTADLFRKQVLQQVPSRFEIGPVYSTNPRDRKTLRRAAAFRPLSKELVFDIDMTDYDDIRTCCDKANICNKCWSFIRMAIKVLDVALREDFGFKHILWVYSGRRGVHAWVCDKKARDLDDSKRKAIAGYMELLKGGDSSGKKVNIKRPLHPHIERSLNILKDHFQGDILQDQDPWATQEKAEVLLKLLPDRQLCEALSRKWSAAVTRSSVNKWADINSLAESGSGSKDLDTKKLMETRQDIVLEYTYPRLDAAVSKHLNHLLKSPFCVHPKTGRICVPIDPANVETFDPLEVPTVTELLAEIDKWSEEDSSQEAMGDKKLADWEKTSIKPYVEYFRGFVNGLLRDEPGVKRSGDGMEF